VLNFTNPNPGPISKSVPLSLENKRQALLLVKVLYQEPVWHPEITSPASLGRAEPQTTLDITHGGLSMSQQCPHCSPSTQSTCTPWCPEHATWERSST